MQFTFMDLEKTKYVSVTLGTGGRAPFEIFEPRTEQTLDGIRSVLRLASNYSHVCPFLFCSSPFPSALICPVPEMTSRRNSPHFPPTSTTIYSACFQTFTTSAPPSLPITASTTSTKHEERHCFTMLPGIILAGLRLHLAGLELGLPDLCIVAAEDIGDVFGRAQGL